MAVDPLDPRTPEEIAIDEALAAEKYLDYRPDIEREIPKAIPNTSIYTRPETLSQYQKTSSPGRITLGVLATHGDIIELRNWHNIALDKLSSRLTNVEIGIAKTPALSSQDQATLINALAAQKISFSNVKTALLNLSDIHSQLILKVWSRAMRDQDLIEGQMYVNLFRTSHYYAPNIQKNTDVLMELMSYGLLNEPNGKGVSAYPGLLASRFHSLSTDSRKAAPYGQYQSGLTAMTSEMYDSATSIAKTVNAGSSIQGIVATQGIVTTLGQTITLGNNINFGGELVEIITILQALRMIILITSINGWVKFLNLEARINGLIQYLINALLTEAVGAFAQVEAMLVTPIQKLMMVISSTFGGYIEPELDQFGSIITNLLSQTNGKFQKELLNLYRQNWIHLHLTDTSTGVAGTDASTKRLLQMINLLITALQTAANYEQAASQAATQYESALINRVQLPIPPTALNTTPPQNANLETLTASKMNWGVKSLPGETAAEMAVRFARRIPGVQA